MWTVCRSLVAATSLNMARSGTNKDSRRHRGCSSGLEERIMVVPMIAPNNLRFGSEFRYFLSIGIDVTAHLMDCCLPAWIIRGVIVIPTQQWRLLSSVFFSFRLILLQMSIYFYLTERISKSLSFRDRMPNCQHPDFLVLSNWWTELLSESCKNSIHLVR